MISGESTEIVLTTLLRLKSKLIVTQFTRTTAFLALTNCSNHFTQKRLYKPRVRITKKNFYITKSLICSTAQQLQMSQQTVYNYTHSSQIKDYLIFKDISILIYGNIVINELSLRQRAVSNFRDKSDPARDTGRQTSIPGLSRPFRDGWQP